LRKSSSTTEEAPKETSDAEPVGSPTRRRNWRGRLGLSSDEE
jgi:hypothetical protein